MCVPGIFSQLTAWIQGHQNLYSCMQMGVVNQDTWLHRMKQAYNQNYARADAHAHTHTFLTVSSQVVNAGRSIKKEKKTSPSQIPFQQRNGKG